MRDLVCLVALGSFGTVCTGVDRAAHLCICAPALDPQVCDSQNHSDGCLPEHDSDKCPVCYKLTIGAAAVVDVSPTPLACAGILAHAKPVSLQARVLREHHEPFAPRGPPVDDTPNS